MRRVESALIGLFLFGAACEHRATPAERPSPGAGPVRIPAEIVREIAARTSVPIERARELAEEDALLAAELGQRDPARSLSIERLVLARELSRALLVDVAGSGPPTDQEVAALTSERWWELDRPRMVQVTHAVVLAETENAAAAALAERIAGAVATVTTEAEFKEAVAAVPALDLKVRVESLPPVTPDGRSVDPARPPPLGPLQHFAQEFAAGAQKLQRGGEISPVVRSPFGYHVMFAKRILEARQPSLAERRELVKSEVMQRRARALQQQVLQEQRQRSAPQQERSALRTMAQFGGAP